MSRLSAIARRDAPGLILLAVGIVLVALTATSPLTSSGTSGVTAGASPFLAFFSAVTDLLPAVRMPAGPLPVARLLLLWGSAAGIFFFVWRLTRNRVVSLGAGFLLAAHPLAIEVLYVEAGLRDLVAMVFLAWMLAVNARPRFRTSRFPNLPPPASSKLLVLLMTVGMLSAPGLWAAPLVLFVMDLPFHREPGRGALERNWRSYLPHAVVIVVGLILELVFGADAAACGVTGGVAGFGGTLGSLFLAGTEHGTFSAVLSLLIVLGAVSVGVVEALFDMGRRRLTLPYVAFAGFSAAVLLLAAPLSADARYAGAAWPAFSGFAVLIPVVAWRFVMKIVPAAAGDIGEVHVPHRPGWEESLAGAHLAPLPDLAGLPAAPRLEEWTQPAALPEKTETDEHAADPRSELEDALARLGMTLEAPASAAGGFDPDFARLELEPLLTSGASVLAFLPSRSPYAATIAAVCGDVTIVERGEGGFPGLRGFDDVKLFEYDGRRPWPAGASSHDLVFSLGAFSDMRTPELQDALAEFERVLRPGGRALLVFRHIDTEGGEDANPLPPEATSAFCEEAGLLVDSVAEAVDGGYRILCARQAQ